jgi:hypothetical protein
MSGLSEQLLNEQRNVARTLQCNDAGPIGGADLFSIVTGLRATLWPGVDADKDADHWLALHACVFGAAHGVQFANVVADRMPKRRVSQECGWQQARRHDATTCSR